LQKTVRVDYKDGSAWEIMEIDWEINMNRAMWKMQFIDAVTCVNYSYHWALNG